MVSSIQERLTFDTQAIVSALPDHFAAAVASLDPELLSLDEKELCDRSPHRRFNTVVSRLRHAFWCEHAAYLIRRGTAKMRTTHIYTGICSEGHFNRVVLKDPYAIAYILIPPPDYKSATEEALLFGVDKMRDMLAVAADEFLRDKDPKMLMAYKQCLEMLDNRVKGGIVHKVEQKNLNMNVNRTDVNSPSAANAIEDIERQIRELEQEGVSNLPEVMPR